LGPASAALPAGPPPPRAEAALSKAGSDMASSLARRGNPCRLPSLEFRHGMTVRLHKGDLPDLSRYGREVAIDTETMGLDPRRDRLCVVQLSPGDGSADVVQIPAGAARAPHLEQLL